MSKRKGERKVSAIKLEQLSVEYVPIDAVRPNEYNPNRQSEHEFNLLLRSISEDGMTQPIIVLHDSRVIVDGEHRWRACQQLGFTDIPVVFVDMSEEQRRVSTLRHNLARGTHDYTLESAVLKDLEQLGALEWAQDALQLSDVELQRMLEDATPVEAYGAAEQFGESWEYTPAGDHYEGGADSTSSMARMLATQNPVARAQAIQHQGLKDHDVDLVKRNLTFTRQEATVINSALGDKPADTVLALAQAHVDAKARASRGEWTPLTFLVPTGAIALIEAELNRLQQLAPNRRDDLTPELMRGLALEYMAVLSAQTPDESVQ
jgi:ParB/RepB/Spo0J family partition protein